MRDINTLSKVGFGTYRVSLNNEDHANALRLAISLGENLIDTASTYQNGDAEKLVGSIIHEFEADNIFIISKAGYVDKALITQLSAAAQQATYTLSNSYSYCIHPDFLELKLSQSLANINRAYIDCYMLHNPEYLLTSEQKPSEENEDTCYASIEKAFIFLEEQVRMGKIRYYGISSNGFPLPLDNPQAMSLPKIVAIAKHISPDHHFKMVQFPYNLIENNASEKEYFNGKTLIEFAKSEGLVSMGNRPLNANVENGTFRLANNNTEITDKTIERGKEILNGIIDTIDTQITHIGGEEKHTDTAFLAFLRENWYNIGHSNGVDHIFSQQLTPLLFKLFGHEVPSKLNKEINVFRLIFEQSARSKMNQIALNIKKQLEIKGLISNSDDRALQTILCDQYLQAGIGHVLVGMRTTQYVHDFTSFLS